MNSFKQVISSSTAIIAPVLGGVIIHSNSKAFKYFVLVNSISFLISGISEILIDFNLERKHFDEKKKHSEDSYKQVGSVLIYLKNNRNIILIIIFAAILNFIVAFGFTVTMPYIVNNVYSMSSIEYGIINSSITWGALLSSLLINKEANNKDVLEVLKKNMNNLVIVFIIYSIIFSLGTDINRYLIIVLYFFTFLMIPYFIIKINIPLRAFLQSEINDELKGRMFGIISSLLSIIMPFGYIMGGLFIDKLNILSILLLSVILLKSSVMILRKVDIG